MSITTAANILLGNREGDPRLPASFLLITSTLIVAILTSRKYSDEYVGITLTFVNYSL